MVSYATLRISLPRDIADLVESPSDKTNQTDCSQTAECEPSKEEFASQTANYYEQQNYDRSRCFEPSSPLCTSWVSEELRSHLIDLYFEWDQPWLQVVNEKLFRDSLASGGRYCSPLLLNCILALGSRYCERVEIRTDPNDPNSAGRAFISEAESLIRHDLRWPKITTIQSLAIMGMVYIVSRLS